MLSNIRIVLLETTHPGNIGAAARAMKTMGLSQLHLVAPARFPHPEAEARASGAADLLRSARLWGSLHEALRGCTLVAGASARPRNLAGARLDARSAARRLAAEAGRSPVAVVFGRESTGLTNAELDRCHILLHIPTAPDCSSLNLAAAVQVVAYELFAAGGDGVAAEPRPPEPPAGAEELAGFYGHLERVLLELSFAEPGRSTPVMRRLKRLYNRARPDRTELNILRGVLTAVEKALRR
ncbi:MAG: RNA methyltransferase [Gammaproteobacteria bacterium]|nr:RNA methyltransferase [Gammaproteobacteria bacterium]NIR97918.1 RNA methyltransferase [Gammaproteobacteria bacterium]NIT63623.1 RNA methyltransferase [Gammaproteobacteria bacterium]NIV20559.1 TrmJ/YjtD family RNA methyltransferase [Gammaproteobacteria bacterium]NIX11153.1 TrmJ/YjtD family RNA methyltransferase [Gammaproteobacteria bacterium]